MILERLEKLESRLQSKYKLIEINDSNYFMKKNGTIFDLIGLIKFNAIVIEYADTMEEAKKYMFEDGDLFYLDEMDEEQMLEKMIEEIEEE